MENKLKLWNSHSSWEESEKEWDGKAKELNSSHPLKVLRTLPTMPGIAPETAKNLKWKSIAYIFKHDKNGVISKYILKKPIKYGIAFIKSLLRKEPYIRKGDFFFYGISSVEEFKTLLQKPDSLFIIGFSYCHKPLECPSGRFTSDCIHDPENPVCRQCFIGKSVNALPEKDVIALFITTIHYIGEKIFEIQKDYPGKKIHFLITACEMTLEMFSDFGNMAGIQGIGVRLDGRICNTMQAFALSEEGIKPGLTVVLDKTQKQMLELIKFRRELPSKK